MGRVINIDTASVEIFVDGMGTQCEQGGSPIYLECTDGKWELLVWSDINREEATHRIDISGALESNRGAADTIATPIKTEQDAINFITKLAEQKRTFHYDDPVETIINGFDGKRLFTDDEVPLINERVEELFGFEFCPFELTMKIENEIWGD